VSGEVGRRKRNGILTETSFTPERSVIAQELIRTLRHFHDHTLTGFAIPSPANHLRGVALEVANLWPVAPAEL
jgi:hypothetical protein